jgi:hypothetical protein
MRFFRSSDCLKVLASCLSALALWSALMAPASALVREGGSGQWLGLCSASGSALPEGHAQTDEAHCGLCLLPALALPGSGLTPAPTAVATFEPLRQRRAMCTAEQASPTSIRGPPHWT